MILIGLTGRRKVGKSVLAEVLVEELGFCRMHPFDGGKAACLAFFRHLGIPEDRARRMVHGDLKDAPCPALPAGEDGSSRDARFLMERLGAFMGRDLGPDWTLGAEMKRLEALGADRILLESIVFEAEAFRRLGGIIIEIDRPVAGASPVRGIETDTVVRGIRPDHVFRNDAPDIRQAQASFLDFILATGLVEPICVEEVPGHAPS